MDYEVKTFDVRQLKISPRTRDTHADFDAAGRDAWLLEDIKQNGVLTPILLRRDGTVEDGMRRVECAKRCGMQRIPGRLLDDTDNVFSSMQLGRNMTLYAKCTMYRDRITALTTRSKKGESNDCALAKSCSTTFRDGQDARGAEWDELTQVLGVSEYTLRKAIETLNKIDEINETDPNRARQATAIFRNDVTVNGEPGGLNAARAFLGYAVTGYGKDGRPKAVNYEVDELEDGDDELPEKLPKPKRAKAKPAAADDYEVGEGDDELPDVLPKPEVTATESTAPPQVPNEKAALRKALLHNLARVESAGRALDASQAAWLREQLDKIEERFKLNDDAGDMEDGGQSKPETAQAGARSAA